MQSSFFPILTANWAVKRCKFCWKTLELKGSVHFMIAEAIYVQNPQGRSAEELEDSH